MQAVFQTTPHLFVEGASSRRIMPFMHYHDTHELYFLVHGEREYFIDEDFKRIFAGDVVLIPRGIMHRTGGKSGSRILVSFSDDLINRFLNSELTEELSLRSPIVFRPDAECKSLLSKLFQLLLTHFNLCKDNLCKSDEAHLSVILAEILLLLKSSRNLYEDGEQSYTLINITVRYINENYANIKSIEDIANAVFVSKYHLCHSFTRHLGISVITYLNTVRIRAAEELISEGKHSLGEIADLCGFNSLSYFSKVFKAQRGIAPRLYKTK